VDALIPTILELLRVGLAKGSALLAVPWKVIPSRRVASMSEAAPGPLHIVLPHNCNDRRIEGQPLSMWIMKRLIYVQPNPVSPCAR
jgi:hypothetical protein